jgi:hypothetical protein
MTCPGPFARKDAQHLADAVSAGDFIGTDAGSNCSDTIRCPVCQGLSAASEVSRRAPDAVGAGAPRDDQTDPIPPDDTGRTEARLVPDADTKSRLFPTSA